jgi:two-component system response regulator PrrA
MNIVVADDEKPLLKFLTRGLIAEGYICNSTNELHEVLPNIRKLSPEVVVLDRLFGSEDSLSIVPSIKSLPSPPMVLMLTALDEVTERVKGLTEGADDYLCKPFDFDELLARITALGRRSSGNADPGNNLLTVGNLVLNTDQRIAHLKDNAHPKKEAQLKNEEITLTKIEFELLHYLMENVDKVLSRERILSRVWQTQSDPHTNIIDVYISRLRKKLEADAKLSIQTLRGNGYRFSHEKTLVQ